MNIGEVFKPWKVRWKDILLSFVEYKRKVLNILLIFFINLKYFARSKRLKYLKYQNIIFPFFYFIVKIITSIILFQ